jgi:RimJ/RimL family protein N-acetyltransferase
LAATLGPCVLEGNHVRLEPLNPSHASGLLAAAQESDWTWLTMDPREKDAMDEWIRIALKAEERGLEHPFTVFGREDHRVLGSTRYLDIRPLNRGVEIGMTWYISRVWGTAVNPECKFLLMEHAFEDWNAVRVQLKTDNNNIHSQNAILKLGAKFEGRLRNHRVRRDGSSGDSMMYSITDGEWRDSIRSSLRKRIDDLGIAGAPQG